MEDLLKYLIAFILGWIIARMMGEGFANEQRHKHRRDKGFGTDRDLDKCHGIYLGEVNSVGKLHDKFSDINDENDCINSYIGVNYQSPSAAPQWYNQGDWGYHGSPNKMTCGESENDCTSNPCYNTLNNLCLKDKGTVHCYACAGKHQQTVRRVCSRINMQNWCTS